MKVIAIVVWSLGKGPSFQGSTLGRVLDTVRLDNPLSTRFAEQRGSVGDDPNGRVGRRCVPRARTRFVAFRLRASIRRRFQERGRSDRPYRSRSSGSRIAIRIDRVERSLLGRLDLLIAPAISSSVRPASNEAADAGTPEDRDLHPMCTLREQTSRRPRVANARKYL